MGLQDPSGGNVESFFAPGPIEDRLAHKRVVEHVDGNESDEKVESNDSPVLA